MLNLKKGLALVLAAATAFTFAPVANLGAPVQAEAAETPSGFDMAKTDFLGVAGTNATDDLDTFKANVASKTYVEADGITYVKGVTVVDGDNYSTTNESNIKVLGFSDTEAYSTNKATANNQGLWKAAGTTLYITFKVTSKNGGSFDIVDRSISGTYDHIHYSVTNSTGYDGTKNNYAAEIHTLATNDTDGGIATRNNAGTSSEYYNLQLNAASYNYWVKVTTAPNKDNFSSWTGKTASSLKNDGKISAQSTSGNLEWKQPDAGTGTLSTTLSTGATPDVKNFFHVTTANDNISSINLYVTAVFDGKDVAVPLTLNYIVDRSDNAFDWVSWNDTKVACAPVGPTAPDTYKVDTKTINPHVGNTAKIVVKSESQSIQFVSTDNTIVSVEQDKDKPYKAIATAHKNGTATINVYVNGTSNNKGKVIRIPVTVPVNDEDNISVKDSLGIYGLEAANTIYLDAADQTAANAVKQDELTLISDGGLEFSEVKSDDPSIASITKSATGYTLKAEATGVSKTSPKITQIKATTKSDLNGKHVQSTTKTITVVVWGKPAADYTVNDVYLNLSDPKEQVKTLQTNPVKTNVYWTRLNADRTDDLNDDDTVFTLTNGTAVNSQTSATVVARSIGKGEVKALVTETATTRPTAKKFTVYVDAAASNVITPSARSLVINEGEQANLTATSSASKTVSFTSADPSVATVATAGGIVAAVKPGQTSITIKSEGAADVVVPVIVNAKQTTVAPAAVTGVKVANKKGAKVTVTWTSQDKNINYRVYKKVGNGSWKAKNVAGNKTTLSVKKGAKVTVKVKAYVKDANGKTTWGPKATQKSLKTDKK